MAVVGDGTHGLRHAEMESCHYLNDDEHKGREHAGGLKRVGPYQRPDAAASGIEPDESHHCDHRDREGNVERIKDKLLQDDANHIEAHRGSCHLRQQKE